MTLRGRLIALVAALLLGRPALAGDPSQCTGHFVNPITDVDWSGLFPLTVGDIPIWPSSKPDTKNPASPICFCSDPIPRIGIAMGFWEPVRLADVTMKPWCFVNLGGLKLDPGFDIGHKTLAGPSAVGGKGQNAGGWQVHWYMYPLIYWLELIDNLLCLEVGGVDIAYITELDPLWQDSELTLIINPEAVIFNNPLAVAACAADCVASTLHLPIDELFWCAGCQGTMYPLNGNISAQYGHVQGSRLAADRFIFKLHREGVLWGSMGGDGLCGNYYMPILKKSQYRIQATQPVSETSGISCPPIGASTATPGAGQMAPVIGEDFGYLIWRKRNCCVG